jgi:hypothetical protein
MIRLLHEWYPVAAQLAGLVLWVGFAVLAGAVVVCGMIWWHVVEKERDGK